MQSGSGDADFPSQGVLFIGIEITVHAAFGFDIAGQRYSISVERRVGEWLDLMGFESELKDCSGEWFLKEELAGCCWMAIHCEYGHQLFFQDGKGLEEGAEPIPGMVPERGAFGQGEHAVIVGVVVQVAVSANFVLVFLQQVIADVQLGSRFEFIEQHLNQRFLGRIAGNAGQYGKQKNAIYRLVFNGQRIRRFDVK